MKLDKSSMLLYAVTDRTWLKGRTLADVVEEAIKAGVTFLQLREKNLEYDAFLQLAKEIKCVTDKYKIPYVINDNVQVAMAAGADGVHVGQGDMSPKDVRKIIGPDKILGVSAQTVEQAVLAEESGADYIGVGSVFPTSTKLDAEAVSLETLKEICKAVSIPVVAIGGINKDNAIKLAGSGIDGIAVVSAIFAQENITAAARELREVSSRVVNYEV
ncbi:thiamine phosphate synthase [Tepidanaerobacter sp. GT38]|uniref:thiamine phosphate synthase n=1 Tax=Tepidanaerobacter sp. GT38 TaxID=2722793 RepID=UPI001F00230F|nr:thiamine phosphate synthase [Tepidanaerobacter sp. GT38]